MADKTGSVDNLTIFANIVTYSSVVNNITFVNIFALAVQFKSANVKSVFTTLKNSLYRPLAKNRK